MAEIRAAQLQEHLQALERLGHEIASRMLADLSPATLRRITGATRVDWLPVELHLELARLGLQRLGEAGLRAWARASFLRSTESSLLGPIFQGAARLFGLSPAALLRTAPAAYRAVFRGCGDLVAVELEERRWRMVFQDLPPVARERAFLLSMAGALDGALELGRAEGEVQLLTPEPGPSAELEVSWRDGGPGRGADHPGPQPPPRT